MNATNHIIQMLNEAFASFDKSVEDSTIEWCKGRYKALQEARKTYQHISHSPWQYYPKMFDAAGGKTMYNIICNGVNTHAENIIRKSEQAKVARRNHKIAKKLTDAHITEIKNAKVTYSLNGFDGVFDVITDKGDKKIIIDTIYAGGYNIQCAHLRVLVKIK